MAQDFDLVTVLEYIKLTGQSVTGTSVKEAIAKGKLDSKIVGGQHYIVFNAKARQLRLGKKRPYNKTSKAAIKEAQDVFELVRRIDSIMSAQNNFGYLTKPD